MNNKRRKLLLASQRIDVSSDLITKCINCGKDVVHHGDDWTDMDMSDSSILYCSTCGADTLHYTHTHFITDDYSQVDCDIMWCSVCGSSGLE